MTTTESANSKTLPEVNKLELDEEPGNFKVLQLTTRDDNEIIELEIAEEPNKAKEQIIDPWSVEAAVDEQGNTLEFDYVKISKYVIL